MSTPLALIQNRVSSLRAREVAVRETADLIQPHHVAQVALVQELVHRERRRQEIEIAHPLAGGADVGGDLVAVPELGLEIGTNSFSITSFDFASGASRSKISAGSSEIWYVPRSIVVNQTPSPGHAEHDDVGERAHEHRIALLEHVVRHCVGSS